MKFDVIITKITNPRSKNIIAKHIASQQGISISAALSMLENLPVTYISSVLKEDAIQYIKQLTKIGVIAQMIEIKKEIEIKHGEYLAEKPQLFDIVSNSSLKSSPTSISLPQKIETNFIPKISKEESNTVKPKKKLILILCLFLIIIFFLFIFIFSQNQFEWLKFLKYDWSKAGTVYQNGFLTNSNLKNENKNKNKNNKHNKISQASYDTGFFYDSQIANYEPSAEEKQMAEAYIDSARAAKTVHQAVAFYKFAISFNKKNLKAWQALLLLYNQLDMKKEAEETEKQMKKLFGENISSIAQIIEPYGTTISMSLTEDKIYRIELISKEGDYETVLLKTYLLIKEIKPWCNCKAVSMHIHLGPAKELLLYSVLEPLPKSYEEFKTLANITFLQ